MDGPSLSSSPPSGTGTKQFVWGWGRLTPAPLLLAPARSATPAAQTRQSVFRYATSSAASGQSSPRHQSTLTVPTSPTGQPEEAYPFESSTAASNVACTLSPTLVEAMETHSVRAIHTAAYHTIAITHGGALYSWLHHSPSSHSGPLTSEDTPAKPPASLTVTQVSRQQIGGRSSKPGSRADSPVTVVGSKQDAAAAVAAARKGSVSSNALPNGVTTTSTTSEQRSEKKFRRVHVTTGQKTFGLGLAAVPSPTPAISAAALGRNQMLAVTTAGQVLSWDWTSSAAGVEPAPSSPSSRGPTLLALPPSSSGVGPTLVNGLACGGQFNVLVTGEGMAYSWGKLGTHGRLGQGAPATAAAASPGASTTSASIAAAPTTPEKSSAILSAASYQTPSKSASGSSRADSPSIERHASQTPTQLLLPASSLVSKVAAGWSHGALVLATGGVATFGCGLGGRLGSGNQLDQWIPQPVVGLDQIQIVDVACGYHHTMAVDVSGRVWAFGSNEYGQLGLGDRHARGTPDSLATAFPDEVVAISCGAFHSAVVTAVGDLYTFGCGKQGQLGFGDTKSSSTPRLVSSLNGMDVCLVACSGDYTLAVTDHFMQIQTDYFASSGGDNIHRNDSDTQLQMLMSVEPDDRDRSDSVTSAGSPHSAGNGTTSPATFLATPPVQFVNDQASGQSIPSVIPHRSPSPAPIAMTADMNRHVPPTPVIFEERDGSQSATSQNSTKVNWPQIATEEEESQPRIRASASSNALADLSAGHHSQLGKSSSFNRAEGHMPSTQITPTNNRTSSFFESPSGPLSTSSSFAGGLPSGAAAAASAASAAAAAKSKTIFQLVKDVFAFPPIIHPDLKLYLPTAKPVSSSDPIEPSDSFSPVGGMLSPSASSSSIAAVSGSGLSSPSDDSLAALSALTEFRPTNLSKKSSSEIQRQREEVSRMNQAYKVKLRKEGKAKALLREQEATRRRELEKESKELAKKNLEREQRMDEAAEVWTKQIVPNWGTQGKSKKTRELVARVGIPPRVRGVVWPLALGNALMITPELYDIFGQQATRSRRQRVAELKAINNAENGVGGLATPASMSSPASALPSSPSFTLGKESTFSYIDVDLTRTYPSLAFFQEECPMNDQLRHLLYTFCLSV
jgi:alpha-tubulin suppressor-like RCC1 family protein